MDKKEPATTPDEPDFGGPESLPAPRKRQTRPPMMPARYQCGEQIGKGGIGSVWRVHDRSMDRALAAKALLPRYKNNLAANERLLREALLAGSLQHPGIPPVYEKGELISGSSFFTMKLVEGKTLEELLGQRKNADENRQYFLNVFRQIADAIGFAHSKKVIHRDLKPQNIMVGEFGEVQIMDWGMAKRLDESDLPNQTSQRESIAHHPGWSSKSDTETNVMSQDSSFVDHQDGHGLTLEGDVMGTPFYMSPEQARGDLKNMNERSDVFSLGSILYEILSGNRLYKKSASADPVQIAIQADLGIPLEYLQASELDAELVSICVRCLQKEPQDRQSDGHQVARAVGIYLDGVDQRLHRAEVERASAEVRVTEEKKRRLTFVKMAWAVGVVSCLGAVGVGWQWSQANENLKEANRQNAVRKIYFTKSLEAIDKMLTRVGYETLADVPGMGQLRKELLQEALGFYEEFVTVAGESSQLDIELARVHRLAGSTHALLGDDPEAVKSYSIAIDLLGNLIDDNPDEENLFLELAACRASLGNAFLEMGESDKAAIELKSSLSGLELGLENSDPSNSAKWLSELAEARLINSALLKTTTGVNESIDELTKARTAFEKIPSELFSDQLHVSHAQCLVMIGRHLRSTKQIERADQLATRAIKIMQDVVEQNSDSPTYRNTLVKLLGERNSILANQGFFEEAEKGFGEQLDIQKMLVRDFPNLPQLKNDLVSTMAQRGSALHSLGRSDEAVALLEDGVNVGEQLVVDYPHTVDHLRELSYAYRAAALARMNSRKQSDVRQSVSDCQRAYELLKEIVELSPEDPDSRYELALAAQFYSHSTGNDPDLSIDQADAKSDVLLLESESILASLLLQVPDNSNYQYRLAITRSNRSQVLSDVDPQAAVELLKLAGDSFQSLVTQLPEQPRYRFQLAGTHDKMATLFLKLDLKEQWEAELREALGVMQQALEKFGENARMIEYVTISQNRLAHCIKTQNKVIEAEQLLRAALQSRSDFFQQAPENKRLERKVASSNRNLAWLFSFWYQDDKRDLVVALEFAKQAVKFDPDASEHWTCLAYIHLLDDDRDSFEKALSQVESTDPFDQMVRSAIRAINFQKVGNGVEAASELQTANELADSPEVLNNWQARSVSPEGFGLLELARQVIIAD